MSHDRRKKLGRALMEALELDGAARQAYVEEIRSREADLADELEGMLSIESGMETDFLAGSAAEEIGAPEPSWRDPFAGEDEPAALEGRHIGLYRLLEKLGEGGMGEVFLAEQKEPLERTVALKLVRSTFRDQEDRARFEAEKTMLQRLEHPNIARILDAGTTDDGFPFFALEVISGERLDLYCDQHELSIRQRLELMIAVCRGVQHAHRKRIIHRDLKPSNILVTEVDGAAVPKIIDFGIAESMDRPAGTRPPAGVATSPESALAVSSGKASGEASGEDKSDSAKVYGTPAYMSPEALLGSGDVDTRTDVYSLGILLYQLLVGVRPFDAKTFEELVDKVASEDPPAPSTRLSTVIDKETASRIAEERRSTRLELRRALNGDLRWILLKAIAKDVDQRYDSVAALADDLERHLQDRPISARPSHLGYRLSKWLARHRWPAVATTLLVAATLGLLIQAFHSRARTERLTRAGQELTRHIERVEWRLRVAHLLPRQDLTAELESISNGMSVLRAQTSELYAGNRGMAEYALGRAALSLGELETAKNHLESAWERGYRRPEAAMALGTTLGRLYERRLDALFRIPDRTTRQILREQAEQDLRDPALGYLSEAESDLALPELLLARMAYYRDDLEAALEQSRLAGQKGSAFFEAKFLEAQVLERQSREPGLERSEILELLSQAESAALEGLAIARSSPEGHLRLCQILSSRTASITRYGQEGVDEAARASFEACATAKSVLPAMTAADLEKAAALMNLVEVVVWDRHQDPSEELADLGRTLEDIRSSDAGSAEDRAEAERLLGLGESTRAVHAENQGRDPRPTLGKSIAHYRRALELGNRSHHVHRELSNVLSRRATYGVRRGDDPSSDYSEAEKHARAAVDLAPTSPTAVVYLGHTLIRRAEYELEMGQDPMPSLVAADEAVERSLDLDPDRIAPLSAQVVADLIRGSWLRKTGEDSAPIYRRVVERATRTLELFPDAAYSFLMGGKGWLELARLEMLGGVDSTDSAAEARAWIGRGLERAPGLPGPYLDLARLSLAEARDALISGRSPKAHTDEALAHIARAREIDGARSDALRLRGETILVKAVDLGRKGGEPGPLLARAKEDIEVAKLGEPRIAEAHLAVARWAWQKSRAGLALTDEEHAEGLAAARQAQVLDRWQMEAKVLEGALLSLDDSSRGEGLRRVAEAVAADRLLARQWRELAAQAP